MTNWLAAPLWPLRIVSSEKAFDNPLLGSERLNRRGLYAGRVALAHRLADRRRSRLAHLVSEEERAAFARDGFIVKSPLPPGEVARLRDEVLCLKAPAFEMREGDAVTRRMAVTPALLREAPTLARLVRSQAYQGPIRYAGSFDVPAYLYIQTIITHVADDGAPDPQNTLHMDTFHPTVKAWLWLEDVTEEMGPFAYVPGSHRLDPRRLAWHKRRSVLASRGGARGGSFRVSDAELARLRLPRPRRFAVPAGTMVAGDTFGLHRRTRAEIPTRRVEIWADSRPNPFLPFTRALPGLPRAIAERRAAWWLAWCEWAHGRGLRARRDWHYVGEVRPKDDPRHPSLG